MPIHYTNTSNPIDFPKQSTIDRLWGEALDKAVPDTYSSLTWTQVEKIKTVFAELIVTECKSVLLDMMDDSNRDMDTLDIALTVINDKFGVEE